MEIKNERVRVKAPVRDWARMTVWYETLRRRRVARDQGPPTLADRIRNAAVSVNAQFLPHYGNSAAVPKWRLLARKLGGPRMLPDFACIGPIKSGTSDLCSYLLQHPCILPPLAKEIMSAIPSAWRRYYPTLREKEKAEKQYGKAISGYFNPIPHSLRLIDEYRAARPDAKIILLLRNPIDRAYSHYKAELFHGDRRLARSAYFKTFADYVNLALDLYPAVPLPTSIGVPLLQAGMYLKPVQLWCDRFGRENVYIVRSEDFFRDVASTVCSIYEFLELPPIPPEVHPVVHRNPVKASPLDDASREKLREFYRPWNEKLYAFIGRDMEWN
nr:hypothetical protein Hi04_10k_c1889_00022 [uncultured bacterium]